MVLALGEWWLGTRRSVLVVAGFIVCIAASVRASSCFVHGAAFAMSLWLPFHRRAFTVSSLHFITSTFTACRGTSNTRLGISGTSGTSAARATSVVLRQHRAPCRTCSGAQRGKIEATQENSAPRSSCHSIAVLLRSAVTARRRPAPLSRRWRTATTRRSPSGSAIPARRAGWASAPAVRCANRAPTFAWHRTAYAQRKPFIERP